MLKYEGEDPKFVNDVLNSLYVDDYASGKNSVPDAFEHYLKLTQRFREGGFNTRKWASNSAELSEMIEKAEQDLIQTDPGTEQNLDQNPSVETGVVEDDKGFSKLTLNNAVLADDEIKVLGVAWNRDTDTLKFNFSVIVDHV